MDLNWGQYFILLFMAIKTFIKFCSHFWDHLSSIIPRKIENFQVKTRILEKERII